MDRINAPFNIFCVRLADDAVSRINDFAKGNQGITLAAFWNFAEMMLLDALDFSYKVGGQELVRENMRLFQERISQHRRKEGFSCLH